MTDPSPSSLHLLTRTKDKGSSFYTFHTASSTLSKEFEIEGTSFHVASPDGTALLYHLPSGGLALRSLLLHDNSKCTPQLLEGDTKGVSLAYFSPCSKFIVTFQNATEQISHNLRVFDASTCKEVHAFQYKYRRESWPPVQFTADEKFVFHLVSSGIQVYDYLQINYLSPSFR